MEETSRVEHMQTAVKTMDGIHPTFSSADTCSLVAIANTLIVIADCLNGIERQLSIIAQAQYS